MGLIEGREGGGEGSKEEAARMEDWVDISVRSREDGTAGRGNFLLYMSPSKPMSTLGLSNQTLVRSLRTIRFAPTLEVPLVQ